MGQHSKLNSFSSCVEWEGANDDHRLIFLLPLLLLPLLQLLLLAVRTAPYLVDDLERRERWPVHLVREGENGQFPHPANFEEFSRSILDALGGIDEHLLKCNPILSGRIGKEKEGFWILTTQLSAAARVR